MGAASRDWGEPLPLIQELERCDGLLDRPQLDPKTTVGAGELRERLQATMPAAHRIGCVHGEFQWSNSLVAGEGVQVVIDLGARANRRGADRSRLAVLLLGSSELGRSGAVAEPREESRRAGGHLSGVGELAGQRRGSALVRAFARLVRGDYGVQPDAASRASGPTRRGRISLCRQAFFERGRD